MGWVVVTWAYVILLHVSLQAGYFGMFSILLFYVQIGAFIAYPEPLARYYSYSNSNNLLSVSGFCPFPRSEIAELFTEVVGAALLFVFLFVTFAVNYGLWWCCGEQRPVWRKRLKPDDVPFWDRYFRTTIGIMLTAFEPILEVSLEVCPLRTDLWSVTADRALFVCAVLGVSARR